MSRLAWLAPITLLVLTGCWLATPPAPRDDPMPAAREAERLRMTDPPAAAEVRELRAQELAAQTAFAQALAAGNQPNADLQRRLAEELGRLRTAAERREREQRQHLEALAAEADRRAHAERAELDQRAEAAQRSADARHAAQRRQSDRRWAGWGLALAAASGLALRVLGLPALISGGVPAAVAAGCLTLAAWSSVPWLATVLGIVLAGGLVVALAMLGRHLLTEWTLYAKQLDDTRPADKAAADAASRARQPAWIRWTVDRLLAHRRRQQAA